jgi:AcrR family transcriptional regulator
MPKVTPEHRNARRRQILDAALRCFSNQGFHRTTMKDIVKQSGLSPGAIYNHFSAKDEIIDAIARERHTGENALLHRAVEGNGKALSLQELAAAFFHGFAAPEHRDARRVGVEVWAEALRNSDVLKTVRRGVDEPRKILEGVVRSSQERGEIPAHINAPALARVMVAIFQGFVLQQAWDPEVDADDYLGALGAILDALAAQAAS